MALRTVQIGVRIGQIGPFRVGDERLQVQRRRRLPRPIVEQAERIGRVHHPVHVPVEQDERMGQHPVDGPPPQRGVRPDNALPRPPDLDSGASPDRRRMGVAAGQQKRQ